MSNSPVKKHIEVACAIIENNGLVLAAQRSSSMSLPLKWEFPGGKIDPGESAAECLKRELMEEMGVAIDIYASLPKHTHHYETFSVTLHPFICKYKGEITLHEHAAICWLKPELLNALDFAVADLPVIAGYLAMKSA